ncbi:PREDICTED: uncharacterized protein LOC109181256 [Ipomoea nil]|uniref:uncharacterized protein LOC109181256 n=1 Tax=Ipomoea nil TaxID=35883 RepID=UPI000901A713|nr:PREDICTED: uncharacterized protein LOC109181256 [Ipomoea nil]
MEEDEHVVIRGAQGGLVIQSSRVYVWDTGGSAPSSVWHHPTEHHGDPPEQFDDEGDVVMDLELGPAQHLHGGNEGAGSKRFLRALKQLLQMHNPCILGLFEPKVSGTQANVICMKLGFSDWVRVEAVQKTGQRPWFLATVYGSPAHNLRRRLWRDLRQLARGIFAPWMVAGDFNSVLNRDETSNYNSFLDHRNSDFGNWIQDEGLIDMGFARPRLTWIKNSTDTSKGVRLGQVEGARQPTQAASFIFQAAWLTNTEMHEVVKSHWRTDQGIVENTRNMAKELSIWNRNSFGNVFIRKKVILARLRGIQATLATNFHRGLAKLELKLRKNLEEIMH